MRYAVIKEGVVENVIEWDGKEMLLGLAGADFIRSDTAGIGDQYENGKFTRKETIDEAVNTEVSEKLKDG